MYSLLEDLVMLAGLERWFSSMNIYFKAESPNAAGANNEYFALEITAL